MCFKYVTTYKVHVSNVSKCDTLSSESCRAVFVGLLLSLTFGGVKIYVQFYLQEKRYLCIIMVFGKINSVRSQKHIRYTYIYIYELIYQLDAIEYLLCTFSSTCFGLTRPSSGAMDVTVSLHIQHMVSLVQLGVGLEECVC